MESDKKLELPQINTRLAVRNSSNTLLERCDVDDMNLVLHQCEILENANLALSLEVQKGKTRNAIMFAVLLAGVGTVGILGPVSLTGSSVFLLGALIITGVLAKELREINTKIDKLLGNVLKREEILRLSELFKDVSSRELIEIISRLKNVNVQELNSYLEKTRLLQNKEAEAIERVFTLACSRYLSRFDYERKSLAMRLAIQSLFINNFVKKNIALLINNKSIKLSNDKIQLEVFLLETDLHFQLLYLNDNNIWTDHSELKFPLYPEESNSDASPL